MTLPNHLSDIAESGFCVLKNFYASDVLDALNDETEHLVTRSYTRDELERHSVYPSDSSETRVSHAVMISEGESVFPKVAHLDLPTVSRFLREHNALLGEITKTPVAPSSRCMINYQNYFAGSKPVGEHFDGEYLRTRRASDGVEFALLEGILPRYVAVLSIANQNKGKGTELIDNTHQRVFKPELNAGDLIIFDNIRLRHRVPTMELPRTTIGVRNFDHLPVHFAKSQDDFLEGNYQPIAEGWVSQDADCHSRLHAFMANEWPSLKAEYSHYF